MKRFIYILAVTSITVMLSASFESQAQNRRSSSSTTRQTTAVKPSYRPKPVRHRHVVVHHDYRPAPIHHRPKYRAVTHVVVRRPPVGHRVTMMDVALTAVVLNSIDNTIDKIIAAQAAKDAKYYYNNGTYYKYDNGEYEVINAPEGALISELPDDAYEVELNGRSYYQVGDDLYKVVLVEGHPFFEVVARL